MRNKPVAIVIGYEDFEKLEDAYESRLLAEAINNKGKTSTLDEAVKRTLGDEKRLAERLNIII